MNKRRSWSFVARAKINLYLQLLGRRPDNYHELNTLMQSLELGDLLVFELCFCENLSAATLESYQKLLDLGSCQVYYQESWEVEEGAEDLLRSIQAQPQKSLTRRCFLLWGEVVLAHFAKAEVLAAFQQLLALEASETGYLLCHLKIQKQTPHQAGLGGGSSDAGAFWCFLEEILPSLRLAEAPRLQTLTALGADVPFAALGGTAIAQGLGERLWGWSPLPAWSCLILKPAFASATQQAFAQYDSALPSKAALRQKEQAAQSLNQQLLNARQQSELAFFELLQSKGVNDFLPLIDSDERALAYTRQCLSEICPEAYVQMSGSGSAFYMLWPRRLRDSEQARLLREIRRQRLFNGRDYTACWTYLNQGDLASSLV